MKRAIALIDGEHYPNVVREALEEVSSQYDLKAAVFLGGTEKIDDPLAADPGQNEYGVPLVINENPFAAFAEATRDYRPEVVVDLSDEPVLGYRERFQFASRALAAGAEYRGADFTLTPPNFHELSHKPSISIIGTGKRIGKTAISGYVSREITRALSGRDQSDGVVVIAMGRGGPPDPEVITGSERRVGVEELLSISRQGKHAASDYLEDAALSWVTTVGCRRCGGGLAGMPYVSNVVEGAKIAESLPADLLIFEGSGAALPPVRTDKTICVAGADQPYDYLVGYLGTYRMLISDMVILTMCEEPLAGPGKVEGVIGSIKAVKPELQVVPTVLRPKPAGDITGKKVAFFTTTRGEVVKQVAGYIADTYGCSVDFISTGLANRAELRTDLAGLKPGAVDVFLTEIKAAAVDVVAEEADRRDTQVVFCDNVPVETDGQGRLGPMVVGLAAEAEAVFKGRPEVRP